MQKDTESELSLLTKAYHKEKYGSNDKYSSNNRRQSNEMLYDNKDESYYSILKSHILKSIRFDYTSKTQWILIISVILLMFATAAERVTFKMSVDKMTPFRFVLILFIFITSTIIYGSVTLFKFIFTSHITKGMKKFPNKQLWIMAILDTIYFSGLIISAADVSPTMTVILLHSSTPCVVLCSRKIFPNRKYSEIQMKGIYYISIYLVFILINI